MYIFRRRHFTLPHFALAPLEFETLATVDELLLNEVVATLGAPAEQVRTPDKPIPTAGELRASIERHLRTVKPCAPPIAPADELQNALAELRQSLA